MILGGVYFKIFFLNSRTGVGIN